MMEFSVQETLSAKAYLPCAESYFRKMREHRGAGEVVDRDHFVALRAEHLPECETADTAETVDCNSYVSHVKKPSVKIFLIFAVRKFSLPLVPSLL